MLFADILFMEYKDLLLRNMALTWCDWNMPIYAPGPRFNIKMTSYQYRKFHCGDKTVARSSYLHNGISYTGKTSCLYWIRALRCSTTDLVRISPRKPIGMGWPLTLTLNHELTAEYMASGLGLIVLIPSLCQNASYPPYFRHRYLLQKSMSSSGRK